MIKKIKIVNHGDTLTDQIVLRDTTLDNEYQVTIVDKGSKCPDGITAKEDTLSFLDDVGDWVSIFTEDTTYEVVEEDQSMTNNNQVNWDEIPKDVEAVVTFEHKEPRYYKVWNGYLHVQPYRSCLFNESIFMDLDRVEEQFGDRFHRRPTPLNQPTPEPPESTQVGTSEVEATTTPKFDWSSVEEGVEAVILRDGVCEQLYKTIEGLLYYKPTGYDCREWRQSMYFNLWDRHLHVSDFGGQAILIFKPPATTPPSEKVTCKVEFYEGDLLEGMIPLDEETKPPSIYLILQEAQQSILKHHGVTGKVKFTVTCS